MKDTNQVEWEPTFVTPPIGPVTSTFCEEYLNVDYTSPTDE